MQREAARHGPPPGVRVFVDFDGTISLGDTTDLILETFADSSWRTIEADWVAGRIGSRECLARQVDLIRASPEALDAFASDAAIDPHFVAFTSLCTSYGCPVAVVSDGLDRIAGTMLKRAGLDLPLYANHLQWIGGRRWRIGFPHAREDCSATAGNCKCARLSAGPQSLRVLVGDGRSDFCAASSADLVIAKGALAEHCRRNGIACEPFTTFADVAIVFTRWMAALRRPVAPQPIEDVLHAPPTA